MASGPVAALGAVSEGPAVWSYWKEFDLDSLRSKLDEQGLAIAESQESSVKNRKKLAESTKEFRRKAGAEVVKEVGSLLKGYQEEVDRLTQRAKFAEGAFLGVYQKLYDAPDPVSTLASALELASRTAELEAQAAKFAGELAEYKAESKELKNQDLTIRKLEERVRGLEAQLEEKERQLKESKAEAEAELAERTALEAREQENRLAEELNQAQASMEALRRLYNASQSQLFSVQSRSEEERAGAQSELEYALGGMERAQARMAQLEKEKEALLAKVQQAAAEPAAQAAGAAAGRGEGEWEALRQELYAHRELAGRLNAEVAALRQQLESEASTWGARCEGLRGALEAKEAHCAALESELATRPSQKQVDDLRQQVRILQAVGYGAVEEGAEGGAGGGGREGGSGGEGRLGGSAAAGSLEAALLEKTRKLEHQLTMLRLQLSEAQGEAEASAARAAELSVELERQKELVARLEEDLVAAERASKPSGGLDGAASGTLRPAASALSLDVGGGEEDHSMLSVLCHQRDRFRARLREVEEAMAGVQQQLARAKAEAEAARADNIALVERLKFVQGYGAPERRATASASAAAADLESGGVVGKYLGEYEKTVNPFTDWKAREREARRRQLALPDRAMYAFGSLISGNRLARSAVFFYALALHAAIFLVLAQVSHHRAENLADAEVLCAKLTGESGGELLEPGAAAAAVSAALAAGAAAAGGGGGGAALGNATAAAAKVVETAAAATMEAVAEAGRALLRRLFL